MNKKRKVLLSLKYLNKIFEEISSILLDEISSNKMDEILSRFVCFSVLEIDTKCIKEYKRETPNFITLRGIPYIEIKKDIQDIVDISNTVNESYSIVEFSENVLKIILNFCAFEVLVKFLQTLCSKICILNIKTNPYMEYLISKSEFLIIDKRENYIIIYNSTCTAKTIFTGDKRIFVHGKWDGISAGLIYNEIWESTMSKLFVDILTKEKGIVFDIGANIGYYSFISAVMGHCVHSFEPLSYNNTLLELTMKLNNLNIRLNKCAVSDEEKTLEMIYDMGNMGYSRFGDSSGRTVVKCIPLDMYIDELSIDNILLLKVDIEGHEPEFIKGFRKSIEKKIVKYIFMEMSSDICGYEKCFEMLKTITEAGYNMYDLGNSMNSGKNDIPVPVKVELCRELICEKGQTDLFFIRNEHATFSIRNSREDSSR